MLDRLVDIDKNHLTTLQDSVKRIKDSGGVADISDIRMVSRGVYHIKETLSPIAQLYASERSIFDQKVLLAETNKKQQIIAKMALGGTGVQLEIIPSVAEGYEMLKSNPD